MSVQLLSYFSRSLHGFVVDILKHSYKAVKVVVLGQITPPSSLPCPATSDGAPPPRLQGFDPHLDQVDAPPTAGAWREILDWIGKVEYDDDYDPKQLRARKAR